MRRQLWSVGLLLVAGPLMAQNFTTAAEVKPILAATKTSWIAVREFNGQDLLYFTHLESWRCGLSEVYFTVNDGAELRWFTEECHEGTAQPNAMTAPDRVPYITLPLQSVAKVAVRVVFDDGSEDSATYDRAAVAIP